MKKIISSIVLIIVGLLILTGCEEVQKNAGTEKEVADIQEKTENMKIATTKTEPVAEDIVGTWDCVLSNENFNEAYTFNEDGTYIYEIGTNKITGTYVLEEKSLTLTSAEYGKEIYEICFNYEKESNNKTYDLVFINVETELVEIELEKDDIK